MTKGKGQEKPPRFVFLYGPLAHGGIETMILRVANHLAAQGRSAELCVNPGGDLERLLDPSVHVRHYSSMTTLLERGKSILEADDAPVIIVSFDSSSAARGTLLARQLGRVREVRHVTGIFHPTDYFMPGQPRDRVWLNARIARVLAPHAMFFMNVECRDSHSRWLCKELSDSPIIPLPVSAPNVVWSPRRSQALRIVSVGRLVDFKAYNLGAPGIVRALLDQGIDATWDIHGYGVLENEIRNHARAYGVEDRLRLHGQLDYADYQEVVVAHDVFVGMGTAAVEAAMCGLPTIVATVGEPERTHGFIQDLPFGNVGERCSGQAFMETRSLLKKYAASPVNERLECSRQGREAVSGYTIDGFVASLERMAADLNGRRPTLRASLWARLFCTLTEGALFRWFLGRGLKRRLLRLVGRPTP